MALGIGSGAWAKEVKSDKRNEDSTHFLVQPQFRNSLHQTLPKSSPQTPRPTSVKCANIYKLSKPELVALTLPFLYHQHPVNHNQFYSQTATQIHPHLPTPSALPLSSSSRFDHENSPQPFSLTVIQLPEQIMQTQI